jgi:hypothetical protein
MQGTIRVGGIEIERRRRSEKASPSESVERSGAGGLDQVTSSVLSDSYLRNSINPPSTPESLGPLDHLLSPSA